MKLSKIVAVLAALTLAPLAQAQGFNLGNALQTAQQLGVNTQTGGASSGALGQQAQQMLMQQALQQLAANPQLVTQMAASLSAQQQASLKDRMMSVAKNVLTPAEQTSLNTFASTPEGASIAAKMPQIVQQMAPVVLQMYASQNASVAPAAGK